MTIRWTPENVGHYTGDDTDRVTNYTSLSFIIVIIILLNNGLTNDPRFMT